MSKNKQEIITREQTIHVHKHLYNVVKKRKAKRAVKIVKKVAEQTMGTKDVRIDPEVNKYLWKQGKRNVPKRIRVKFYRKLNEDEEAKEKLYTLVTLVPVASFKGLQTKAIN